MKKIILRYKGMLKRDDLDRLESDIEKTLNDKGFIVVDDRFEVFVIDDDSKE